MAECYAFASGYQYMGTGCPAGGSFECRHGNSIAAGAKQIADEECMGVVRENIGNGASNGHCTGPYTQDYTLDGKNERYPLGGWHRETVWEVIRTPTLEGHGHGDPHLQNIKGEDFDVMQEGNMLLVETPRHSSPSALDFALRANIERLGATLCGPTYITKVGMEGRWVGDSIHIKAGKVSHNVQDQVMHGGEHAFAIHLSDTWRSHATFDSETQGSHQLSSGVLIQTLPRTFVLMVRGLNIVVSQPKRPRVFLDLQITGLETLSGEVGGLLGIDDHSEAERLPEECV